MSHSSDWVSAVVTHNFSEGMSIVWMLHHTCLVTTHSQWVRVFSNDSSSLIFRLESQLVNEMCLTPCFHPSESPSWILSPSRQLCELTEVFSSHPFVPYLLPFDILDLCPVLMQRRLKNLFYGLWSNEKAIRPIQMIPIRCQASIRIITQSEINCRRPSRYQQAGLRLIIEATPPFCLWLTGRAYVWWADVAICTGCWLRYLNSD